MNDTLKIDKHKPFSDTEFYSRGVEAGYVDHVLNNNNLMVERYDILKGDLKRMFDVETSSKYFAFLVYFEDGNIAQAHGANSGSNMTVFKKTAAGKKYAAEEFLKLMRDNKVPLYVRK